MRVLKISPAKGDVKATAVFACGCEAVVEKMAPLAIGGVVLCKGDERGTHAQVVADMIGGILAFTGADGQPPSGKPGWGGSPLEVVHLTFESHVRVVGSGRAIATVVGGEPERRANAMLFAAAPEMRDALLLALEELGEFEQAADAADDHVPGALKAMRAIEAALVKAGVR